GFGYWGQNLLRNFCELEEAHVIMVFDFFFFFQAEDGIRDGHVTGVQTCALPISPRSALGSRAGAPPPRGIRRARRRAVKDKDNRSEERRVGKECRSRWSRYHEKKKTEVGREPAGHADRKRCV